VDRARGVAHAGDRGKSPKHHAAEAKVLRESGAARAGAADPGLKARAALRRRFKPPYRKPGGSFEGIELPGSAARGGGIAGREAPSEEPGKHPPSDRSAVRSTGGLTKEETHTSRGATLDVAPPGSKGGAKGAVPQLGEVRIPRRVVKNGPRRGGRRRAGQSRVRHGIALRSH
jgi:hypothetical protein